MLDTLILSIDETLSTECIGGIPANKDFPFHGLVGRLKTTDPGSYYHRRGADWILTISTKDGSVPFSGPVYIGRGKIELVRARVNVPRLLDLAPGSLPESDSQLESLWPKLLAISLRCIAMRQMRATWLDGARVKELHITMNYEIPFDELAKHHINMRHPRVHKDPIKFHPSQGSYYWPGKDLCICLYDKTRELLTKAFKQEKGKPPVRLPKITRLEFRLKGKALEHQLQRAEPAVEIPPGQPPLPTTKGAKLAPKCITAALLLQIFRNLVDEFPSQPKRRPQRLNIATFVAMLHKEDARLSDGTPAIDFYSRFASDRNVRNARSLSATVDTGGDVFRWQEFLGPEGWGPRALFVVHPH